MAWILGEEDMVLRWGGEQWNAAQGLQYSDGLFQWWQPEALAITSGGAAVVGGAKGIFLRSVNALWWPLLAPPLGDPRLSGVAALDVANGWAVGVNAQGSGGTCKCWRQEPAPSADINALWSSGPNDVWATSAMGAALLRWDGRDWLPVVRYKLHQVRGVSGSGPGDVWFVGERGAILRYRPWTVRAGRGPAPRRQIRGWCAEKRIDRASGAKYNAPNWPERTEHLLNKATAASTDGAMPCGPRA